MNIKSFFSQGKYLAEKFRHVLSDNLGHEPNALELAGYSAKMIHDYCRYHATFSDFFDLAFYKKKHDEKKEYMTAKDARKFAIFVDGEQRITFFNSKCNMYRALDEYVKRDQLFLPEASLEEFCAFAEKHGKFLCKPDISEGGYGIFVVETEGKNLRQLYPALCSEKVVLDEMIEQAEAMQCLCPTSVNTVRIFTLRIGTDIQVMFPLLRMGDGTKVVDNFYSGGLISALDLNTGVTLANGLNSRNQEFEYHPVSHVKIKGFQVPRWNALVAFVLECADNFELDYVAWDIAIRENDFVVIEANPNGGSQAPQMAGGTPKRRQYAIWEQQIREYREHNIDN